MTLRDQARVDTIPLVSDKILSCLKPLDGTDDDKVELTDDGFRNVRTDQVTPLMNGVPSLFMPTEGDGRDVTDIVKSFYEENPFPNYEGLEEFGELVNKGSRNAFSAELLKSIGYNKKILECGCGTGQLSHFLQLNNNHVLGIDMSLSSLALAIKHKQENDLTRGNFVQMNIFNLAVKDNSFDVVISHGVLHHTYDARKAFSHIVKKAKPGGYVVVGLYNRYARVPTWVRSKLIGFTGQNIDFVVRKRILDERKAEIWIRDQYYNPHETWHSIDEVMEWFEENGVEYLNTSPSILGTDSETTGSLFDRTDHGNSYQRLVTQLGWLGTISREGALFDLIGKKRA